MGYLKQRKMNTLTILSILFVHWFADFVCQTDKMAQGKSKNWFDLLSHTGLYSVVWGVPAYILIGLNCENLSAGPLSLLVLYFCSITFVAHTITDYFTSRLNSKLWNDKKVHYFFVSIGFDQWLHYVQLFLTFKLLI